MTPCSREQAERLGGAVRFRTISIVSATPGSEPAYGEFAAFLNNLRREFPRAADALRWEQVGELTLLLTWASGDSKAPGLLFYAHFDVVPTGDESAWSRPPFRGEVAEGYIWGRGTLDNKNCLMGIMEAVESLLSEGFQPSRTIYLAFGGDEELGGLLGAGIIAHTLADRGVRLECVFDEGSAITDGILSFITRPVAMIGIAEKGFANIEIVVEGKPGHSAMPGRGTVPGALAAVAAGIERKPFPARLTPTVARFFRALAPHSRGAIRLALRFLQPLWPLLKGVLTADPSVDSLLRTTQAFTIIQTGQVPNVIPSQARAVINVRLLPGDTAQSVPARIERIARKNLPRGFSLLVHLLPGAITSDPVPESPMDPELWKILTETVLSIEPRAIVTPFLVNMATDSRHFRSVTESIVRLIPAVLSPKDVARIHGVDERISLENYGRIIAFYTSIVRIAAGRKE